MSFEGEKQGLQAAGDALNLAMTRGAFGFNDIEILSQAKNGLAQQYHLLDGGLSAVLAGQEFTQPTIPEIKMAIAQPAQELDEEVKDKKITKRI